MNSYFASVEQQFDVKLRGKPVGVCAYLSKNGCIIASSMEAKMFGVKTGMRVREALKLCPKLSLVENDPEKYRTTTQKIFTILKDYSDEFEPYSIDEAFLHIPYVHNEQEGFELGQEWIKRIKQEVGEYLRSSVGFAYSHFYTKVFSDNGPKDSVFHVPYPQLDNFLANLELEDIWGIGRKTALKLRTLKLFTPFDVKHSHPDPLIEVFGKNGYDLWQNLNHGTHSMEHRTIIKEESPLLHDPCSMLHEYPKSIGHSYCLPLKTYDLEAYKKILYKLCERTCIRLREMNKVAYGISFAFPQRNEKIIARNKMTKPASTCVSQGGQSLSLSHYNEIATLPTVALNDNTGSKSHASFKTPLAISDALDMYRAILPHLENLPKNPLYMIAVSLFRLESKERMQPSLFDSPKQMKKDSLLESFDHINNKWGPFTLQRGLMLNTQHYAKERIGFRKL